MATAKQPDTGLNAMQGSVNTRCTTSWGWTRYRLSTTRCQSEKSRSECCCPQHRKRRKHGLSIRECLVPLQSRIAGTAVCILIRPCLSSVQEKGQEDPGACFVLIDFEGRRDISDSLGVLILALLPPRNCQGRRRVEGCRPL